ncbi:MAG: hypothetical protein CMH55_10940 [Myxococcales bacterium]|nr:hypothetical protein [Myxococcales bacterium]
MSLLQRIEAPSKLPDSLAVPGSKSLSHRALILSHHCPDPPVLDGLLNCADTEATHRGMAALGDGITIDCGNSGTTLRFLLGQAALLGETTHFVGDASLSRRTNASLLRSLEAAGVWIESRDDHLPISIRGPLQPGLFSVAAELSSQFLSSLLLALPFATGDSRIQLLGEVPSQGYVELTQQAAAHFGLMIEKTSDGFQIPGNQTAQGGLYPIEGDWSAAGLAGAFSIAMGQPLRLANLQRHSRQSDRALPQFLEQFGASVRWHDDGLSIHPGERLAVPYLDLRAQPDLLPPMAVLASLSPGPTRLQCSPGIRHK